MNRRQFLKLCALVGLQLPFNQVAANVHTEESTSTLILIELQGGNDGLNTVIPYSDPLYYEYRPKIAIQHQDTIQLNSDLALHHALEPIMHCWERDELAILLGVGYRNPNLSHFRSIEIWNTASQSDEYLDKGWLSDYLESGYQQKINGLVLNGTFGPLQGLEKVVQIKNLQQFLNQPHATLSKNKVRHSNPALEKLIKTNQTIEEAAQMVKLNLAPLKAPVKFKQDAFAKQASLATQIIQSNLDIPAIKLTLPGFDTHINQLGKHARLLSLLSENLYALRQALVSTGHWNSTRIMTYSEFGRRVKENGSEGTDHGTAAPHFVLGGGIKGGLIGNQPKLDALHQDNLQYTTDFTKLFSAATSGLWPS